MARYLPPVISSKRQDSAFGIGSSLQRPLPIVVIGVLSLLVAVVAGLARGNPLFVAAIMVSVLMLPLIWQRPVLSVYILAGAAVVFETFGLGFSDSLTDQVPFFKSVSSEGGPGWLVVTPAETLMLVSLTFIALKRMSVGERPLRLGSMFWAVAPYTVMVVYGLVYGLGTGGHFTTAMWEARAHFYLFLTYLLVVNTLQHRNQVSRILWIILLGIALKGVLGTWRFLVTLGGDTGRVSLESTYNSILSHEESFLFALFLVFILILFLFQSHKGQLRFGLFAAIPICIAFLANERRMGNVVVMIGLVLVVALAYKLLHTRRSIILRVVLVTALIAPIYLGAAWNSSGIVAEPARAVKSLIQPNDRDADSNDYREIEARNVKYNIQINPILGRGYGKPIIFYDDLPYIGDIFAFWNITPHNTILWVWMRLGFVGFLAFWFLVGRSLIGSMLVTRQLSDPYLRSVGVLVMAGLVMWVAVAALDMGLVNFRASIIVGMFIALVSQLPALEQSDAHQEGRLEDPSTSFAGQRTRLPTK